MSRQFEFLRRVVAVVDGVTPQKEAPLHGLRVRGADLIAFCEEVMIKTSPCAGVFSVSIFIWHDDLFRGRVRNESLLRFYLNMRLSNSLLMCSLRFSALSSSVGCPKSVRR